MLVTMQIYTYNVHVHRPRYRIIVTRMQVLKWKSQSFIYHSAQMHVCMHVFTYNVHVMYKNMHDCTVCTSICFPPITSVFPSPRADSSLNL